MRIGMLSFAHLHAESYIHNLRAIPDVEMIGIADEDQERGRHFAQVFNAHLFDSYAALLAEKPDGVVICSENSKHYALVQMAAEAGVKHILSEKPLATTLEDADAMMGVCESHQAYLMTAFPMRFNTPMLEVKKLVDANTFGRIYACKGTNQGECPKHHRAWFVDKHLAGGGAIMDHTVHLADILRWCLKSEVVEVFAETNHILYADEVEVETGGLVMLRFENGVFASIDCSWSKPPYYPTWGGLTLEVIGEQGFVTMDAFNQRLTVYRHEVQRPLFYGWGSDSNQAMMNEFAASIRENRAPSVTGYDGYKALEIALAAYRSAETGAPVSI